MPKRSENASSKTLCVQLLQQNNSLLMLLQFLSVYEISFHAAVSILHHNISSGVVMTAHKQSIWYHYTICVALFVIRLICLWFKQPLKLFLNSSCTGASLFLFLLASTCSTISDASLTFMRHAYVTVKIHNTPIITALKRINKQV